MQTYSTVAKLVYRKFEQIQRRLIAGFAIYGSPPPPIVNTLDFEVLYFEDLGELGGVSFVVITVSLGPCRLPAAIEEG